MNECDCELCGSETEMVHLDIQGLGRRYAVQCMNFDSCGITGPMLVDKETACEAWDEIMNDKNTFNN